MKKKICLALGLVGILGCGDAGAPAATPAQIDDTRTPLVTFHTNHGAITIELYEDQAPNTVKNFVSLVESGFYSELLFHRVIKGFMMQGGCPETKGWNVMKYGMGGPGYAIADEFHPGLKNTKGYVSMANSGPNTGGSQFFILFGDAPHLDGKHAVFGKVTAETQGVVDKIEKELAPDEGQAPKSSIKIEKATVDRKRNHAYEPVKS